MVMSSDNGSNVNSVLLNEFLTYHSVSDQLTAKNRSQQNGKVERFHRTLNELLRCGHSQKIQGYTSFEQAVKTVTTQ
jgi:transposase InsO family protein